MLEYYSPLVAPDPLLFTLPKVPNCQDQYRMHSRRMILGN